MKDSTLNKLKEVVLPYYQMASDISPVIHIDKVVEFATEISIGEWLNPVDKDRLIVAALFHDIGLSKVKKEKKVVESDIARVKGREKKDLITKACKQRMEHMLLGADITRMLLDQHCDDCFESDIDEICRLVKNHDNIKIAKLRKDKRWLNDKNDLLLQLLNEADALWMLTPEGLQTDIDRGSGFNLKKQMQWNIKNHQKVYDLYSFYNKAGAYQFRGQTLYRSKTGYEIFKRLTEGYI